MQALHKANRQEITILLFNEGDRLFNVSVSFEFNYVSTIKDVFFISFLYYLEILASELFVS